MKNHCLGASTVNASASKTFLSTALPAAGAVTVSLTDAPVASWVGQSLVVGRWLSSDGGDFAPGTAYVIESVDVANKTVTLKTPLGANFAGAGTETMVYSVVSNYGEGSTRNWTGASKDLFGRSAFYHNVIDNAGLIASRVQASELSTTTVSSDNTLINAGTLTGNITLANVTAGSGTVTGAITNAGTMNAGTGTLSVTGDVTMQSGSVLKSTVDANAAAGKLAVTGTLAFANGANVRPVAASGYHITEGAQYTLATATSITGTPTLLGNGLVSWQSSVQNNTLTATAHVNTASVANLSTGASAALTSIVSVGGTLAERILSLDSEAAVQRAAEQLKPDVKGTNVVGAMAASSAVSGVIGGRSSGVQISSLLRRSRASGVSTGEAADGAGLWFQAFGFIGEQQARGGQEGYGVNSGGIIVGADQLRAGADRIAVGQPPEPRWLSRDRRQRRTGRGCEHHQLAAQRPGRQVAVAAVRFGSGFVAGIARAVVA